MRLLPNGVPAAHQGPQEDDRKDENHEHGELRLLVVGDDVQEGTPERVENLDLHYIDAQFRHVVEPGLFELQHKAAEHVDYQTYRTEQQNRPHQPYEVHVFGDHEVAGEDHRAVGFGHHGVEVGHEVEVGVAAAHQEIEGEAADGEGRVEHHSQQLDHSIGLNEHLIGALEVEAEQEDECEEEGEEYEVAVVLCGVGVVLLQQLGVLVHAVHVCAVVVLYALQTVDGVQKYDLERFVVVQVIRHVGSISDPVVGVVEVANGQSAVLQRPHPHKAAQPAIAIDHLHAVVAVHLHPVLACSVDPVLQQNGVLQQFAVPHHMHRLQGKVESEAGFGVMDAGAIVYIGFEHAGAGLYALALIAVGVDFAEIADAGDVVPGVAAGALGEALAAEKVAGQVREALGADRRGVYAAAARDVAKVASLRKAVDELAGRTEVETVLCVVSQVESLLTLCALEVGPPLAPHALKGAFLALHGNLVVVIKWAVAGMVGHIGHIAIHARNYAEIFEQIGLVPASRVAPRAVGGARALEAVLVAFNTVGYVRGGVRRGSGVVSDLVHCAV